MPIISGSSAGGKISGVTVTGVAASGAVPVASGATAGVWAFPPGFEIGYDQITATVTITSTTEASGTAVISAAAHTFDGGPVMAEFYSPVVDVGVAASTSVAISLFEGATQIGELGTVLNPVVSSVSNLNVPFCARLRFTPTVGSHTYTVSAFKSGSSPVAHVQAGVGGTGANLPAFIRFTKV